MNTDIGALTIIFSEFYYWITIPLMFLINVGFCMYEVGTAPTKTMLHLVHRCGLGLAPLRPDGQGRCAAILQ